MKPIVIGLVAAAAVVAAFLVGAMMQEETEGPLEKVGETIDEAADK